MSFGGKLLRLVSDPEAQKNLNAHGSIWGKPEYIVNKKWKAGRLKVRFKWRSKNNLMGRFGGGWNWHVGAEWGKTKVLFFLLVAMLSISWDKMNKR